MVHTWNELRLLKAMHSPLHTTSAPSSRLQRGPVQAIKSARTLSTRRVAAEAREVAVVKRMAETGTL